MLQTYQGHFREDVRFYSDDIEVKIPTNKLIVISILDIGSIKNYNEALPLQPKRKHIPLKERLKDFNGEYEFEEWNTGADVGIEVIQ